MALSREEISQIAKATANEVIERRGDICKCVDWFLLATASAEALEHNATVSDMAKDLHEGLKEILPEKQLEDLEFKYVLLQGYVTEGIAEMALSGALGSIRDKCNADISEVKRLASSGFESIKKRESTTAAQNFSKLKGELVRLANNICGPKESNPGAKEPWQMTREEYVKEAREWRAENMPRLIGKALEDELTKVSEGHKYVVLNAIGQGKPVPAKVLADYPNLKPPAVVPAVVPEAEAVGLSIEEAGIEWNKLTPRQRQPIVEQANIPSSFAIRNWEDLPLSKKDAIAMNFPTKPHQSNPESSITQKGEWTYIKYGVEEIKVKESEGGLEVQRVLPGPPISQDDFDAAVKIAQETMIERS